MISVISNWEMLQMMVRDIAEIRRPSLMYRIRSMYARIRLGVKEASVIQVKMARKASLKDIPSIGLSANCHWRASIPQLSGISATTSHNFHCNGPLTAPLIWLREARQLDWWITCHLIK